MNRSANVLSGLTAVVLLLLSALSAPARPVAAQGDYYNNFEQSLKPWVAGAGSSLALQQGDSACPFIGVGAAHLAPPLNLRPGPRLLQWMQASFPSTAAGTLTVSFAAKSDVDCGAGCAPAIYIGSQAPTAASPFVANFPVAGSNAWSYYHYAFKLGKNQANLIYVALGLTPGPGDGPIGPAPGMSYDCLRVQIQSVIDLK
jgi:hypothetical protein